MKLYLKFLLSLIITSTVVLLLTVNHLSGSKGLGERLGSMNIKSDAILFLRKYPDGATSFRKSKSNIPSLGVNFHSKEHLNGISGANFNETKKRPLIHTSGSIPGIKIGSLRASHSMGVSKQKRKGILIDSTSHSCKDALCTEYLSDFERKSFLNCQKNATRRLEKMLNISRNRSNSSLTPSNVVAEESYGGVLASGGCRFMNGKGRGPVGLVSFPGSGNTWVRGLLQQATGICTGAVYCDASLRLGGMDGEGIQGTSVLIIKSHSSKPTWSAKLNHTEFGGWKERILFDSVIFIIRNPFHALVSEWNRVLSTKRYSRGNQMGMSHVEQHGKEHFGWNRNWTRFIRSRLKKWEKQFNWIISCPKDRRIFVIRYEDLRRNVFHEVQRMLAFLQYYDYSHSQLLRRLRHGLQQKTFQRPKGLEFEHFTPAQRKLVNKVIQDVIQKLLPKVGTDYHIEEYIQSQVED